MVLLVSTFGSAEKNVVIVVGYQRRRKCSGKHSETEGVILRLPQSGTDSIFSNALVGFFALLFNRFDCVLD